MSGTDENGNSVPTFLNSILFLKPIDSEFFIHFKQLMIKRIFSRIRTAIVKPTLF